MDANRSLLDPEDPAQVAAWCRSLGLTDAQLRTAIALVGVHYVDLQQYVRLLDMSNLLR